MRPVPWRLGLGLTLLLLGAKDVELMDDVDDDDAPSDIPTFEDLSAREAGDVGLWPDMEVSLCSICEGFEHTALTCDDESEAPWPVFDIRAGAYQKRLLMGFAEFPCDFAMQNWTIHQGTFMDQRTK